MRIVEATALDPYGRLPYDINVEDRLPYSIGASMKYSTTNGPEGQVYWEDRNVFGGAERLRLQADVFYAPPWYVSSQSLTHFSWERYRRARPGELPQARPVGHDGTTS